MLNLNIPMAISAAAAIGLHLVLFLFLCFSLSYNSPSVKKKLLVTTVRLQPKEKMTPATAQAPKKAASNVPQKPVHLAKEEKKAAPKKESLIHKTGKSAKVPEKANSKTIAQEKPREDKASSLLAKAQESLKKIKKEQTASPFADSKPDAIESQEFELAYKEELASLLKLMLRLPELGDLNLKLTIAKDGAIQSLEILSSESLSNRKYVEKTLPQLTMPPLGKQFGNAASHTFTITMRGV